MEKENENTSAENMSGEESLALIHRMIAQAQNKFHDDGFFYLLWGWLVFVASISCYVITEWFDPQQAGWPWAILMPAGGVISAFMGWRKDKKRAVKTYTEAVLDYVLTSFLVCLFIVLILVGGSKDGWVIAYPLVMMIYGMWLFISGGMMRFRPLIIGGVLNWA